MICDFNLDNLKFDEKGLIPAVVTESDTGKLLTLAYMNRESLEISIKEEMVRVAGGSDLASIGSSKFLSLL